MQSIDYLARVGGNITRLCKRSGMTTVYLSDLCGMEKSNLIPIEKGRINATVLTLARIADALEVDLKELFQEVPEVRDVD